MVDRGLTERQRRFTQEYILDGNGTQAAIRAGYSTHGAEVRAFELVRNSRIAAAIQTAQKAVAKRNEITLDEIVAGLRREADSGNISIPNAARVAAWMGLAKLGGFITDKVEARNLHKVLLEVREEGDSSGLKTQSGNGKAPGDAPGGLR